jgi:toxin ParE1/3/4
MRRFRLSPLARADLAEIRHFVARDKPEAADRLIRAFYDRFGLLAENPLLGERQPEFGEDLRTFSMGSYVVVYRPMAAGVEIARVVSGYRDLQTLF